MPRGDKGAVLSAKDEVRSEAALMTAVMQLALQGGAISPGLQVLLAYGEPPSKRQVEADHPVGSEGRAAVETMLMVGELLGTYVKHGALSADFVRDVVWLPGIWAQLERYVTEVRAEAGEDSLYENFEALAKA